MPIPRSGEVLIKVTAAPVNPSDYGEWSNVSADDQKNFEPRAIGKEGSGVVVASGGGVYGTYANYVVGSNVGFISNVRGQGSYAEYTVVNAITVMYYILII